MRHPKTGAVRRETPQQKHRTYRRRKCLFIFRIHYKWPIWDRLYNFTVFIAKLWIQYVSWKAITLYHDWVLGDFHQRLLWRLLWKLLWKFRESKVISCRFRFWVSRSVCKFCVCAMWRLNVTVTCRCHVWRGNVTWFPLFFFGGLPMHFVDVDVWKCYTSVTLYVFCLSV